MVPTPAKHTTTPLPRIIHVSLEGITHMKEFIPWVLFSEPADIHRSNINQNLANWRAAAWVGVSSMNFWANPERASEVVQFIHGSLSLYILKMSYFRVLWIICSVCLSLQAPFPAMVWPLVFPLPCWVNNVQELLKLGLTFIFLHHGQVVIESSQAGPEVFVTQAPYQILIKMSEE